MPPTFARRVFVVRHGARLDHANKAWADTAQRPQDSPLSSEGHAQAERLGKCLYVKTKAALRPVSYIYCSPFVRCVQTAMGIAKGLELDDDEPRIRIENGLAEESMWMSMNGKVKEPWFLSRGDFCALAGAAERIDMGYESHTDVQMARGPTYPGRPVEGCSAGGDPYGAEAKLAYEKRSALAARNFVTDPRNAGKDIILVAHGASCASIVHALCPSVAIWRYIEGDEARQAFVAGGGAAKSRYTCCTELVLDTAALAKQRSEHGGSSETNVSAYWNGVYRMEGELFSTAHDPSI